MRSAIGRAAWQTTLCFTALLIGGIALRADGNRRPRLFLIVCDGLTLDDLNLRNGATSRLTYLAQHGSVGLMSCAVPEPKTDTSALLTIAAGRPALAERTDEQAANDWEKAPGERISAAESHRIRSGQGFLTAFDPRRSVKHLGVQELKWRGLDRTRLGEYLAEAAPPVRARLIGNADTSGWRRRGALLTVDRLGVGGGLVALRSYDPRLPYGLIDNPAALVDYALQDQVDFVVIQLGDGARADSARARLSESEYREAHDHAVLMLDSVLSLLGARLNGKGADILVIAPRPPAADASHPLEWGRLTPILGYGPDFPPGAFTSATTRTTGLIANTDIAPTILRMYNLPVPTTMIGRPVRVVSDHTSDSLGARRLARLARLDFLAWANSAALAPFLCILGGFCFLCCIGGLFSLRAGRRSAAKLFAFGLLCALNFPAAQLFAPLLLSRGLIAYGLIIAAWMAALAAVTFAAARLLRVSVPVAACALNLAAVLTDLVSGGHLLKDALISDYYLSGFRYYGIGNDYLGLIVAYALAGPFSVLDDLQRAGRDGTATARLSRRLPVHAGMASAIADVSAAESEFGQPAAAAVSADGRPAAENRAVTVVLVAWAGIAIILGWPAWGANSGSLVVTCVAFGLGWRLLRCSTANWLHALTFCLAGVVLMFGFAFLDARIHGDQSGHAGSALRAANAGRGLGYLTNIITGKIRLHLTLFSSAWTWVTASLIAGALLIAPMLAANEIDETRRRRAWLARSSSLIVPTAIAALIFKDTGIVTVCYLLAGYVLVGFYYLLTPSSRSCSQAPLERN